MVARDYQPDWGEGAGIQHDSTLVWPLGSSCFDFGWGDTGLSSHHLLGQHTGNILGETVTVPQNVTLLKRITPRIVSCMRSKIIRILLCWGGASCFYFRLLLKIKGEMELSLSEFCVSNAEVKQFGWLHCLNRPCIPIKSIRNHLQVTETVQWKCYLFICLPFLWLGISF